MIDLNKTQIVEPAVKCWVRDFETQDWKEDELLSIDHRTKKPYIVNIAPFNIPVGYTFCVLENPNESKRELMNKRQILGKLANETGILVRYQNSGWRLSHHWRYEIHDDIEHFEWVKVDIDGNFLTEPSKFWR